MWHQANVVHFVQNALTDAHPTSKVESKILRKKID